MVASSKDCHMLKLSAEAVFYFQFVPQALKHRGINVLNTAAFVAHQMMVMRFSSRVIAKASPTQVSLGDQMQCFQ